MRWTKRRLWLFAVKILLVLFHLKFHKYLRNAIREYQLLIICSNAKSKLLIDVLPFYCLSSQQPPLHEKVLQYPIEKMKSVTRTSLKLVAPYFYNVPQWNKSR